MLQLYKQPNITSSSPNENIRSGIKRVFRYLSVVIWKMFLFTDEANSFPYTNVQPFSVSLFQIPFNMLKQYYHLWIFEQVYSIWPTRITSTFFSSQCSTIHYQHYFLFFVTIPYFIWDRPWSLHSSHMGNTFLHLEFLRKSLSMVQFSAAQ